MHIDYKSVLHNISIPIKMLNQSAGYLIPRHGLILSIAGFVGWYAPKYIRFYLDLANTDLKVKNTLESLPTPISESIPGKIFAYIATPVDFWTSEDKLYDLDKFANFGAIAAPITTIIILNLVAESIFKLKNIPLRDYLRSSLGLRKYLHWHKPASLQDKKPPQTTIPIALTQEKSFFDDGEMDICCDHFFNVIDKIYKIAKLINKLNSIL